MDGGDVKGFYEDFGRRVRVAREKAGVTQGQLAARIGLTRSSIANLEAGRQKVLLHALYGICDALDLDPADLMPERRQSKDVDLVKLSEQASSFPADDRAFVLNVVGAVRRSVSAR
ncbi:helix-turn-helix domain-containing protein [Catellatospora tritici]|uniref:helix-turn-helix domain-containing protein n=1 Tax=Catellatospora tritici TaxID=2851566 RepID=UPI001C2CDC3B|nr:helix-turn-helix transcriptional regulator [Catellatospora tritici]MBV1854537.1 helix-turn-helix domain-containing protein [Catellatospora tritici]